MNIGILGGGAWGTAVAIAAARDGSHASLWLRDPAQAMALVRTRRNARYLPDAPLPPELGIVSAEQQALALWADGLDLLVIATPVAGLRASLVALRDSHTPMAWLCKGFEAVAPQAAPASFGLLPHEVFAQVFAHRQTPPPCAVLSGPSFAAELARGQPTALVAASHFPALRQTVIDAFHGPVLRIYASEDVAGVEVGGAVKNVLALATGLCDGLQLGLNARAALITRGLAEMTRLGLALGARKETFMGLSGLGDLVLTATGDLSRNRRVGLLLAQGHSLEQAITSLGHVAEGVYCARTVVQRARHLGIDMPIAESVVRLLDGSASPQQVVQDLMARDPKAEA